VLVLVKVTVFIGVLAPRVSFPQSRLDADSDTWDTTFPEPLPDKATEGLFPSDVISESAPGMAVAAVGRNVTLTVQLFPGASEAGQLLL